MSQFPSTNKTIVLRTERRTVSNSWREGGRERDSLERERERERRLTVKEYLNSPQTECHFVVWAVAKETHPQRYRHTPQSIKLLASVLY